MIFIAERTTIKKNFIQYIAIIVVLLSLVIIVSSTNLFSIFTPQEKSENLIYDVSIIITSPEWNIKYTNVTTSNYTVADLLFECADVYNFSVKKSYFPGYNSYYIDEINGIVNGNDNRYWQYYVNNELADMGCSTYLLQDGDIVEWCFEVPDWT